MSIYSVQEYLFNYQWKQAVKVHAALNLTETCPNAL